jgi:hypothetical protein
MKDEQICFESSGAEMMHARAWAFDQILQEPPRTVGLLERLSNVCGGMYNLNTCKPSGLDGIWSD